MTSLVRQSWVKFSRYLAAYGLIHALYRAFRYPLIRLILKYKIRKIYDSNDPRIIFERIYNTNWWGEKESISGTGSTLAFTERLREGLPDLMKKHAVKRVFDAPLKIRLLHIITSLDQGGAESMLTRLASGLGTEFEHCVVSLTGGETANEKKIVEAGGKVINLKMNNFFGILSAVFSIRNEILKYQPDIIQTWLYHADLMGLLVKRVAGGRPLVWSVRCSALAFSDAPWSTHLLLRLLAVFSFVPEAVVFNSSVGRNSHKNLGYQSRIEKVIHNGFDLREWRAKSEDRLRFRNEIGTPDYGFLVGMVARFHSIKDHRCFLLAAERIHATNPHVRFVMVGSGIEIQNVKLVKDIQELGLGKVVCLVGPRIDMVSVLSGLDCLVLTSKSEGFPNVLGEAMSAGIPCVSTDAGDAHFILDGVGAVIPVGDAEGVANAVSDIIKLDPASRRLISIRGRERIKDRFEISDVLSRYSALYKDLDGNKKIKI
jgi:glycosyltransferase involved in cell wall biosynthesis